MPEYHIIEVNTRRDLRRFVAFPDHLYKDCPQYVPALHSDQIKSLTKVSSLSYCKHKLWIVLDGDDKVVGRICGMVNPRYNDLYHTRRARFGWFDTINDIAVARLLIETAVVWAREQGMDEIHGPLYYNTLGKQGMLTEGFDNIPPFNCIYNYPYYNDLIVQLGFEKECDWVQYTIIPTEKPEKTCRVADLVTRRYNLRDASIDKLKRDKDMVRKFFKVYNESFASSVYNFVPFTDEEIAEEASDVLKFVSDRSSSVLMDENGEPVAFGIMFPSISKALQKAKGHLFPFGWWHLLKAMRRNDLYDLMLNGAAPEWQNRGVSAVYFCKLAEKSRKNGLRLSITNPQIETNSAVNLWNSYEHELYMRRRCYIKKI